MELTFFQYLILGVIQGITEWLPISSSGMITLVVSNFFNINNISEILHIALFFHLGTFFSALIYFRKEVADLFVAIFNYKRSDIKTQKVLKFLLVATLVSTLIGLVLIFIISRINLNLTGKTITFGVGLLLLVTALFQLLSRTRGLRSVVNLKNSDGLLLGGVQGLAALPGISRSGITVSTLLLKKFDDTTALSLSFLMSLPVILFGNLLLNLSDITKTFATASIYGLLAAFVFGLLTIHGLIRLSKKINFGWFILVFAILMMLSIIL